MTAKQYRVFCAIKVTKFAKLMTHLTLSLIYLAMYEIEQLELPLITLDFSGFGLTSLIANNIVTFFWLHGPDIYAYIAESIYHIKHDWRSYR